MRGKRYRLRAEKHSRRIIPAHAGQTFRVVGLGLGATDHPRACGANTSNASAIFRMSGSSPRMRGKQLDVWQSFQHVRIIPAHAGQTRSRSSSPARSTDHPRACGANGVKLLLRVSTHGSSPRMRGKHGQFVRHGERGRIIPAHAGQTAGCRRPSSTRPDHPRACGANVAALARLAHHVRIIPAHAGQTWYSTFCPGWTTDHPRACGANLSSFHTTCIGS